MPVEIHVLDAFLPPHLEGRPVSLIKMDVEGFEATVLQGSMETLKTHMPVLLFEFWPYGIANCGGDPRGMMTGLAHLGYAFHEIRETEQAVAATTVEEMISRYTADERAHQAYLLALPPGVALPESFTRG